MAALPVCPPDNGEVILFPKPENCSEFYQCAGGVLFTHRCQVNLYYCEEKQYCSWPTDPDCKFDCVTTKTNLVPAAEKFVPAADPECPPQTENVTFIPNPNNCSEFFECDNGVPVLMSCPAGLYFCSKKEICDWIWDPECKYDCHNVKSKTVIAEEKFDAIYERADDTAIAETTTIELTDGPTADPLCPPQTENATFIANPNNCSEFFECDNGVLVQMSCPPGLYFCSEKQICDWLWDSECKFDCNIVKSKPVVIVEEKFIPAADPECPPQTDGVVTYLPNPDDCNKYYECSNEVPVPMHCPDFLYFCTQKNSCDWIWDSQCTYNCKMPGK
jgi:valyl-tRNA synthetase